MKTVAELIKYIERDRIVGPSSFEWFAANGEPYVVVGSQYPGKPKIPGTVDEGKCHVTAPDEETAVTQALACFQIYAEKRGKYLFWRFSEKCALEWNSRGCFVYLRCLVSKKPAAVEFLQPNVDRTVIPASV